MIVVFTDEAGDDIEQLDATVDICRKFEMPVYVVGVPAPFGREDAYIKYVDPDPNFDQTPQWLPLHQGPESLLPERIKLNFAGMSQYDDPDRFRLWPVRLVPPHDRDRRPLLHRASESQSRQRGLRHGDTSTFSTHLAAFFDERIMRNYRPDYVTADQYKQLLAQNRACAALVEAAQLTWTSPMEDVRLRFPKVDDAQFARELSNAQRSAAKIEPQIEQLVAVLRKGEPDRPKADEATLAGRIRPGDRPRARRRGSHRRLQRHPRRGQARHEIQGRKRRHVDPATRERGHDQ